MLLSSYRFRHFAYIFSRSIKYRMGCLFEILFFSCLVLLSVTINFCLSTSFNCNSHILTCYFAYLCCIKNKIFFLIYSLIHWLLINIYTCIYVYSICVCVWSLILLFLQFLLWDWPTHCWKWNFKFFHLYCIGVISFFF